MKTNMKKAIVPTLFALALAAGCKSTPPPPPTVNEILASKNIVLNIPAAEDVETDGKAGGGKAAGAGGGKVAGAGGGKAPAGAAAGTGEAANFVKVASPFRVFAVEGGNKRAQMRIRNVTEEAFGVSYRIYWFDKFGAEILERPPKTILLQPMSTASITDFCTEPAGVTAEIEMRLVPADQVEDTELTFENAAKVLVSEFSSDAQFLASLRKVQTALGAGKKPVMVVRALDDNSGKRQNYNIQTLAKDFRSQVRKTGLLDVKDDAAYQEITDRLNFSADGGLERNTMLAAYGTHVPPDFILTGELRLGENGKGTVLFLTLHDLSGVSGRGGTIAWEDKALIGE